MFFYGRHPLQSKVFPNQAASKCNICTYCTNAYKFPPVEVLSAENVAIPAIEKGNLREKCVQKHTRGL